jgi:hypothetical protein
MTHCIKLQTSCGEFDPKFMKALPALEKAMTAHGVDPADFLIAKDHAAGPLLPIYYRPDGNPVEYTVFVKGQSFSVRQPDDMSFMAYFYGLCAPPAAKDDAGHPIAHASHEQEKKLHAFTKKIEAWFNKPI